MSKTMKQLKAAGLMGGIALSMVAPTAHAFSVEISEEASLSVDSTVSMGAVWRVQDPHSRNISKRSLDPTLCTNHTALACAAVDPTAGTGGSNDFAAFAAAPGAYTQNNDNGNINYDKGDAVKAAAKITTDMNLKVGQSGAFVRAIYFYDEVYSTGYDRHLDTTFQPARTQRSKAALEQAGSDIDVTSAFFFTGTDIGEESYLSLKVGKQPIPWGESTLNVPFSLNHFGAPDLNRIHLPGFDLKEAFQSVEAVQVGLDMGGSGNIQAYYQYKWRPVEIDPLGDFFSGTDVAGDGGTYAMLSFGYHAEDPTNADDGGNAGRCLEGSGDPFDRYLDGTEAGMGGATNLNGNVGGHAVSNPGGGASNTGGRTLCRGDDINPRDDGQYGVQYKLFLDDFNGGTEVGLFFSNYHSRFPYASISPALNAQIYGTAPAPAVLPPVLVPGVNVAISDATVVNALGLADSTSVHLEYPEDIELFGASINTNIGTWNVGAEVSYRPDMPLQIHGVDLTFCALAPAFQESRGLGVPSYVERFRFPGVDQGAANTGCAGLVKGEDLVRGYERLPVAQFDSTVLWLSGNNPFGADQWIILGEFGALKVFGMPDKDVLQFDAPGQYTHLSQGKVDFPGAGDAFVQTVIQNPERADKDGFADSFSWGYKWITILQYNDIAGFTLKPIFAFFHDVNGNSPGPGGPFVEDRKQVWAGMLWEQGAFNGGMRYVWHTGAGANNVDSDKDFFVFDVKYSF